MDSDIPLRLFFLLLLPYPFLAQNGGNVKVGDSQTADDQVTPWRSPSADFAFGFRQVDKKGLYLLAIWYNKIPDETIVWYANGDVPAPRKSKVELTAERGLVLSNPQGVELWKSGMSIEQAANGFMNDTGNFVVASTNGVKLWQSFDHPTDTLLPTQKMEKGGMLSSRRTETNFSRGRFQFRLTEDGNAVLNTINLPTGPAYGAYYSSNTADSNSLNAGYQVVFNESGYLYVLKASNEREPLTSERVVPANQIYHRATLNFDGVFILYSHPKDLSSNGSWSAIHTMPENICTAIQGREGTGACGFNGVCTLSTDRRPICECPRRFSLLDPNDKYGGCKPDFPTQFCEEDMPNSPEEYDWEELSSTNWPFGDYEKYTSYTIEECKKTCLQDCFCNVFVFNGVTCWKKKLPLSNGMQGGDVFGTTFIKIRKGNFTIQGSPSPSLYAKNNNKDSVVLVVSVLLGGSVFFNFTLVAVISFCYVYFYKNVRSSPQVERAAQTNLRYFSYEELVEATNGFKEELGRGSFGIVYKGLIDMGSKVPIAIKKLDRRVQEREREFKAEVNVISQTHHKNLVRLIGCCNEGQHRLLVYEFLSNGTLASFLFGDIKLSWSQRTQIACGIARGLQYLHEECSTQIIHCDIKPQNILLDECYDARISDFGLAKLLFLDQSQTFTAIRGTKGYVAAEWFRNLPITTKVDVYSFGVLLLEIVSCKRSVDTEICPERAILAYWAYDCYQAGKIHALVENDEEALIDKKKLERFVMVAMWCIQEDPTLRPTMKMVMLMLEGIVQVPVPPCPYSFTMVNQ